ncbi:MAG: DUF11 domain-containing protein, partial [Bacilli bacterium]|nr:DUF11 domain-containing protein [Bacilli bacterium]
LTATFNTNLVSPGDSLEYDITVTNSGTLNAVLEKITVSDTNNPAIKFTTSGLTEGDALNAGDSKVLTVKVEYDNNVTSQPDNLKSELTVTLDYAQEGSSTVIPTDNMTYRFNNNSIKIGDSLEGVETTTDYTTLNKNFFLRHKVVDGKAESADVCFIKNGLHCLVSNEYETNKTSLLSIFSESECNVHDTFIDCSDGTINASASMDNGNNAYGNGGECYFNGGGYSYCM